MPPTKAEPKAENQQRTSSDMDEGSEIMSVSNNTNAIRNAYQEITREEAEAAVTVLLRWAGDDPNREGLIDTPDRLVRAFEEYFVGYSEDPVKVLGRTFEETDGYDEMVLLKDIPFESHCEHHLAPIIGRAHVAYLPKSRVVGISKLARVVDIYAKRLQIQEKMTAQISNTITNVLDPKGVAVVIQAQHQCMTCRGVHKQGVDMVTSSMTGLFRTDQRTRSEFLNLAGVNRSGGAGLRFD